MPDTEVECISDLIFFLSGLKPPLVRRSKLKEDTELIRLSFRDIMWYCYLSQTEIDSSFFNLEKSANHFKRLKSRDVMRLILGYHQENVSLLESELAEVRNQRTSLLSAVQQLRQFLDENNIEDVMTINSKIDGLKSELISIQREKENLKKTIINVQQHLADELRYKAKSLISTISELENAINDINNQIIERKNLLGEFTTASIKLNRSLSARMVLKGVNFNTCPQCGISVVDREVSDNHCSLCTQPLNLNSTEEIDIINVDLATRRLELQESIKRLEKQNISMMRELNNLKHKKNIIDSKLIEIEREYDSAYLAKAKELERRIGEISAEIDSLTRLLSLHEKIDKLENLYFDLASKEEQLKVALKEAKKAAEKDATSLRELKSLFLENLLRVGLPGVEETDLVKIDTSDFIPHVLSADLNEFTEMEFSNLGSGGKMTIFKCCFALAIHRLVAKTSVPVPTFLMIDTPMKNISERENKDDFERFYKFVYQLYSKELKGRQLIIVDKEFFEYKGQDLDIEIRSRHMTPDDSQHPPLIYYYRGH